MHLQLFFFAREAFDCIFHLGVLVFAFPCACSLVHVFKPLVSYGCVRRILLDPFYARLGHEAKNSGTLLIKQPIGALHKCKMSDTWKPGKEKDKEMGERGLAVKEWTPICMYVG